MQALARGVAGELGGGVGIRAASLPQKLIDVLDRIDQRADYNPRRDYALTVSDGELTPEEREARSLRSACDVVLDV